MTDSRYTKQVVTMQYTETMYYKDGELLESVRNNDDHSYDAESMEPMTDEEIEDYDND